MQKDVVVDLSSSKADADPKSAPTTWDRGPLISELERRRYEFEGGGAASERDPRRSPGRVARLFRLLMRGR